MNTATARETQGTIPPSLDRPYFRRLRDRGLTYSRFMEGPSMDRKVLLPTWPSPTKGFDAIAQAKKAVKAGWCALR